MNLSNEHSLQVHCLQSISAENSKENIKSLKQLDLNWDEFIKSAKWHGIEPILFYKLKNIPENRFIPRDVMDVLKNSFYTTTASNMAMYDELTKILEEFNNIGLETIVLKGAVLAKTVYSNIALRPMLDVDILVKKEYLNYAELVLEGLGFMFKGNRTPEWYRENYYHMLYANPKNNILIELHWHIVDDSYPSKIAITGNSIIDGWWERAKKIEFNGKEMQILCPEDSLFLLCLHFLKHRFQSPNGGYRGVFTSKNALIQLCDIYLSLKYYKDVFNWVNFNKELEKYGAVDIVYSTLFLVQHTLGDDDLFFNTPISFNPDNVDEDLVGLMRKRLFDREYIFSLTPYSFIQSIFDGNFQKKIRNLFKALFPHPEMLSNMYSVPMNSKKLYVFYLKYLIDFLKSNRKQISVSPSHKEIKVINRWIGYD